MIVHSLLNHGRHLTIRKQAGHRSGISLLEVLISIGVITFGIFGVASLIPVAQFKVAEGTSRDRQAGMGPSAVAQFRIQNMDAPNNWLYLNGTDVYKGAGSTGFDPLRHPVNNQSLRRRPFCIDPLGMVENRYGNFIANFPANATNQFRIPRLGLKSLKHPPVNGAVNPLDLAMARNIFLLQDELEFDRPDSPELQPRRQFFVANNGKPIGNFSSGSMSWFATLSPTSVTHQTDEFLLSVVIIKNRVPLLIAEEENFASMKCEFAGEIRVFNSPIGTSNNQMRMSDLRVGDWILMSKQVINPAVSTAQMPSASRVVRWTRITGTTDEESATVNTERAFTIANDDFLNIGQEGHVIFVRGVKAVYERTIRLENATSAWD